nr:immunoglobulin heavy chain junction region [Mus musculus]
CARGDDGYYLAYW